MSASRTCTLLCTPRRADPVTGTEAVLLSDRAAVGQEDPEDHRGAALALSVRLSTRGFRARAGPRLRSSQRRGVAGVAGQPCCPVEDAGGGGGQVAEDLVADVRGGASEDPGDGGRSARGGPACRWLAVVWISWSRSRRSASWMAVIMVQPGWPVRRLMQGGAMGRSPSVIRADPTGAWRRHGGGPSGCGAGAPYRQAPRASRRR